MELSLVYAHAYKVRGGVKLSAHACELNCCVGGLRMASNFHKVIRRPKKPPEQWAGLDVSEH